MLIPLTPVAAWRKIAAMDKLKFPKTLKEFREQFSEEAACFQYMGQSRWPEGFACPRCSGREHWIKVRRHVYECCECGL